MQIAQHCQELLHQPKAGEQVASVWGCGAGLVLEETRTAMSRILKVQTRLRRLHRARHWLQPRPRCMPRAQNEPQSSPSPEDTSVVAGLLPMHGQRLACPTPACS